MSEWINLRKKPKTFLKLYFQCNVIFLPVNKVNEEWYIHMYVCMCIHICVGVCRHIKSFVFFAVGKKHKIYHPNHFICVHSCIWCIMLWNISRTSSNLKLHTYKTAPAYFFLSPSPGSCSSAFRSWSLTPLSTS